jgi:hypothetical protein
MGGGGKVSEGTVVVVVRSVILTSLEGHWSVC